MSAVDFTVDASQPLPGMRYMDGNFVPLCVCACHRETSTVTHDSVVVCCERVTERWGL